MNNPNVGRSPWTAADALVGLTAGPGVRRGRGRPPYIHFRNMTLAALAICAVCNGQSSRWPQAAANAWYAKQPWLVGSNYIPSNAVNQLEMWQAETFDPARIDMELGWAEQIGMNTMYVFGTTCPGNRTRRVSGSGSIRFSKLPRAASC